MKPIYETYLPPNFNTLNSYLFVEEPEKLIQFMKDVFNGKEVSRTMDETNTIIRNVIMQIGNSSLMVSQASEQFPPMPTAFYLFVENCDEVYKSALSNNAESVMKPIDTSYGDRQGGVKDLSGNYWWISTRMVKEPYADK